MKSIYPALLYSAVYFKGCLNTAVNGKRFSAAKCSHFKQAALFIFLLSALLIKSLPAEERTLKEEIAFGNPKSEIEVYFFTDWECPACRFAENTINANLELIQKNANLFFIDYAASPETLNFTPFNLSFMIHNKSKYMFLRHMLEQLAHTTKRPTEAEVSAGAQKLGETYQPLSFSEATEGVRYFENLAKNFSVKSTPSLVIINNKTKKGRILIGPYDISRVDFQKAIDSMKIIENKTE